MLAESERAIPSGDQQLRRMGIAVSLMAGISIAGVVYLIWNLRKKLITSPLPISEHPQGTALGRPWNINMDPHESGMDI
jgi:hypothetical protein